MEIFPLCENFHVHFQLKTEADNMEEPVPVELEGFGPFDVGELAIERNQLAKTQ